MILDGANYNMISHSNVLIIYNFILNTRWTFFLYLGNSNPLIKHSLYTSHHFNTTHIHKFNPHIKGKKFLLTTFYKLQN